MRIHASHTARAAAALAAGGGFWLAVCGPLDPPRTWAEEPTVTRAEPVSTLVTDAAALPSDTSAAIVVRPAELAQAPLGQLVAALFDQLLAPLKLGVKVAEIEEFKAVLAGGLSFGPGPNGNEIPCAYIVLRGQRPHDWKKPIGELLGASKEAKLDGHSYFHDGDNDSVGFWIVDDRTVVLGTLPGIVRTFSTPDANDHAAWEPAWKEASASPVAGLLHMSLLDSIAGVASFGEEAEEAGVPAALGTLNEHGDYAVFHGDLSDNGLVIKAQLACRSAEGAELVVPALRKGWTMLSNSIAVSGAVDDENPEGQLGGQLAGLVAATQITTDGSTVRISSLASNDLVKSLVAVAQSAAKAQAMREANQQKLTAIAAAMNKYHDEKGHYPPAVCLGPDGTTPHSWRVEILPYLAGGEELAKHYRFNEAWDSEHNRQVMNDGRELFAASTDTGGDEAAGCSYFLMVGKGALYDGATKPARDSVTDGAGKTILLVEARRIIAWTQPEDLAFDADTPLPSLGGNLTGFFAVACVDGTVQAMATGTDATLLHSMLSKSAGDNPEAGDNAQNNFQLDP